MVALIRLLDIVIRIATSLSCIFLNYYYTNILFLIRRHIHISHSHSSHFFRRHIEHLQHFNLQSLTLSGRHLLLAQEHHLLQVEVDVRVVLPGAGHRHRPEGGRLGRGPLQPRAPLLARRLPLRRGDGQQGAELGTFGIFVAFSIIKKMIFLHFLSS